MKNAEKLNHRDICIRENDHFLISVDFAVSIREERVTNFDTTTCFDLIKNKSVFFGKN